MKFSCIDGALLKGRTSPEGKLFKCLSRSALCCVAVLISLCQISTVVAMENGNDSGEIKKEAAPVLGDPNYKLDYKYAPIYGSMDGKSFFLHYCLPGFIPRGLGDCKPGLPGRDPRGVQVHYEYSLNGQNAEHSRRLEGGGAFLFPFPVNVNLEGKTPYLEQYKRRSVLAKERGYQVVEYQGELKDKYEGLVRYESVALPGGWWVPKDTSEYQTRLGNPPIFVCSDFYCTLTLDQGNGWMVDATFNEAALNDWRAFFVQFNESIKKIMEQ